MLVMLPSSKGQRYREPGLNEGPLELQSTKYQNLWCPEEFHFILFCVNHSTFSLWVLSSCFIPIHEPAAMAEYRWSKMDGETLYYREDMYILKPNENCV